MRKPLGLLVAAGMIAVSLLSAPAANASETISGSGSSYAGIMFNKCVTSYTKDKVTYNPAGSGTGQRDFKAGTTTFGASDSPYNPGEQPSFPFTYVPLVGGPIAVAYNVPGLNSLNLTPKIVSDIFLGKITKWNDPAIKAINKGAKLPGVKINVVYRKDNSGTSYNFTNFLAQTVSKTQWKANLSFLSGSSNKAVGIQGDKNQGVRTEMEKAKNSIGYLDLADAQKAKFGLAAIQNGTGQFVRPSINTTKLFMLSKNHKLQTNGIVNFDYKAKVRGGYPVVLIAYGFAPTNNGTAKGTAVKDFFTYVVNTCVPQEGAKLGYLPFTGTEFLKVANAAIARIK
jgi:phosphate transport system substrate-binding protein